VARYLLLQRSLVAEQVLEAGTEIGEGTPYPFDGKPGPHMKPLDATARIAVKAFEKEPEVPKDPVLIAHPEAKINPGVPS
jgi:hypothetical protein